MAYNLVSFVNVIEQIMHPPPHYHHPNWALDPEIEYLLKKAQVLKQLFKNLSQLTGNKIESLGSRIRDATYEAEDILESHLVDQIRSAGNRVSFTFSPTSLKKVIGEFDSAEKEIKKMTDGSHIPADSSSRLDAAASSSRTDPNPKKILVGLSQDSHQLKDWLTGQEDKLMIIPIVGMGGIGKTTLAQNLYDDRLIVSHFDTRAWVTISQEYNVRVILLGLLACIIGKLTDEIPQKENDQLAVHLHQSLWGRRYLIVLDDVWEHKAWDDIRRFFPDDKSGSRIMVTTREMSVANYAGSVSSHHKMHLLNEDDSWNLLRQKVFAQEICSPELETIGKTIAHNCGGLPLAIHVIGGVLSQAKRTQESWMQVARDVTSVIADNDEQFSSILSLSYNHLPNHLKPCFLYMSAFPEDYEIRSSRLIRLLVAEGLVEPVSDKGLEETAEMYLKSLVDRNLIFVCRQETNGIVKSYNMHDLLRDLCIRKASEEKFLYTDIGHVQKLPEDKLCVRRVSTNDSCFASMELMSLARSIIWGGGRRSMEIPPVLFALQLLRVLDLTGIALHGFPKEMLQLINLRYLDITCDSSSFPSSISTLSYLQTIIFRVRSIHRRIVALPGIFDIPQLRHIKFKESPRFYSCSVLVHERNLQILGKSPQENLETLYSIAVEDGFDRIIASLPNLKKLGIFLRYFNATSNIDLRCLCKLETVKLERTRFLRDPALSFLVFPPSLKKLTLHQCEIPVGFMNKVATLPILEVLKLRSSIFEGSTWEPTEGQFNRLQFLSLVNCSNLEKWEADETHFPILERLVIEDCPQLKEIPSGIGEIPTLERIELHNANPSLEDSARKIEEEQLELGNYGLQVLIK